jgi:pimeloyl-ACP methyl ester carboxylesterase
VPTIAIAGLTVHTAARSASAAQQAPIVYVHGIWAGAWAFANYLPFFAERGHDGYAIELRGRGVSRPVEQIGRVRLRDFAEDVRDVVREVHGRSGRAPVLMGHSMGGLIAQKVAESEELAALVLLCSAPPRWIPLLSAQLLLRHLRYAPVLFGSRPFLGRRADVDALAFTRITSDAERARTYGLLVPDSGRAALEIAGGALAVDAERVRCEVLSVGAADDAFVPPRVARALARKYGGTHLEFSGHAHMLPGEPGWERPAEAIEAWLRRVAPA